jgi:hypothetical protein
MSTLWAAWIAPDRQLIGPAGTDPSKSKALLRQESEESCGANDSGPEAEGGVKVARNRRQAITPNVQSLGKRKVAKYSGITLARRQGIPDIQCF